MDKKKFYMTTAIAYTSGKPHIGNTYEIVLADSIARFKREQGYDVFFQTGTDEHGQVFAQRSQPEFQVPETGPGRQPECGVCYESYRVRTSISALILYYRQYNLYFRSMQLMLFGPEFQSES